MSNSTQATSSNLRTFKVTWRNPKGWNKETGSRFVSVGTPEEAIEKVDRGWRSGFMVQEIDK